MDNANETCVGPQSDTAGKADSCSGCPNQSLCSSGKLKERNPMLDAVNTTMDKIGRTLLVLSGKGGVGKSTVASQLAFGLARQGKSVGLLDLDITGPSIPKIMGISKSDVHSSGSGWSPVYVEATGDDDSEDFELGVMSIGLLVEEKDRDNAIIWRGPKKDGLIQQFFTSVDWGELDFLIIDTPPGTSDEHISIVQLLSETLKKANSTSGAVVVSTPQEVAMSDVRKELSFCKQVGLNVLGIIENMGSAEVSLDELKFVSKEDQTQDKTKQVLELLKEKCPELLEKFQVQFDPFPRANGGPEALAEKFNCAFLGKLPMDSTLQQAGENGLAIRSGRALDPLNKILAKLQN